MSLDDLTPPEREEYHLRAAIDAIRQRAEREMYPFIQALARLQDSKPSRPFALPDGQMMRYVGPVAPYQPTPTWLLYYGEQLVATRKRLERDDYRGSRFWGGTP